MIEGKDLVKKIQVEYSADFSFVEEGVGHFRANVFYERGKIGLVFRHVKKTTFH